MCQQPASSLLVASSLAAEGCSCSYGRLRLAAVRLAAGVSITGSGCSTLYLGLEWGNQPHGRDSSCLQLFRVCWEAARIRCCLCAPACASSILLVV